MKKEKGDNFMSMKILNQVSLFRITKALEQVSGLRDPKPVPLQRAAQVGNFAIPLRVLLQCQTGRTKVDLAFIYKTCDENMKRKHVAKQYIDKCLAQFWLTLNTRRNLPPSRIFRLFTKRLLRGYAFTECWWTIDSSVCNLKGVFELPFWLLYTDTECLKIIE